jgi:hypothetical protein
VNTFQAAAVGLGSAVPEAVDPGDEPAVVLPADGAPGDPDALALGVPPAVQAGAPFPSLLQPASAATASARAAATLTPRAGVRRKVSVPVMGPA